LLFLDYAKNTLKWEVIPELVETMFYHQVYQYCGRIDVPFREIGQEAIHLVDIKTGAVPVHAKYQLEGYGEGLRSMGYYMAGLHVVNLPGNGQFKLVNYGSARDLSVFMACVTIENAKRGLI